MGGVTPLHAADWNGHIETTRFLLEWTADMQAKGLDGQFFNRIQSKKNALNFIQKMRLFPEVLAAKV